MTDPVRASGGVSGESRSRDACEIGFAGDDRFNADSGDVISAGGDTTADAAVEGLKTSSAGGSLNGDGEILSTGGNGGAMVASTGGKGGAISSIGGDGGSSDPADARSGSGDSGNDASAMSGCDGVVDSSICWRLGALGASCADTCAASGGTSPDAPKHVGTTAQGGSRAECQRLLGLFGIASTVIQVSIYRGLGCHVRKAMLWPYGWAERPDYSDDASAGDANILCGCKH